MNTPVNISIKGNRDGLLVAVASEYSWAMTEVGLLEHIQAQGEFFKGARVALDVGELALDRDDIKKLRDKLAEHDVTLWAVLGKSAETIRSARREDLETEIKETLEAEPPPPETTEDGELPPIESTEDSTPGIVVKHTVRSGRVVKHIGHVIVIGDVNPGAQIIAGGDVLVWGRLRGTVHAGATGDEEALVCALDMRPMQLRIANLVATVPDDGTTRPHPEVAFIREGRIVAEEWGS